MALLSAEHLAGPGYIILNVLRAINIITLCSVVASSVVMLVKTFMVSKVHLQTMYTVNSSSRSTVLLLRCYQSCRDCASRQYVSPAETIE